MAIFLAAAVAIGGCETSHYKQIGELRRTKPEPRVLLMPLDVELAELSAGGLPEPKAEWTAAARGHMLAAIRAEKEAKGLRLVEFSSDDGADDPLALHRQLVMLNRAVSKAVMIHLVADLPLYRLPSKQGRLEWSLGPGVRDLKEKYAADYALFLYVRDSYSSPGRATLIVIAALLGVVVPGGAQVGFATLVDLDTGDVVWINRLARGAGDLRTAAPAGESVRLLLTGFPR